MYSLILMATMAAPTTAPDCFRHRSSCQGCYGSCYGARCSGCSGCYGTCQGSCYGSRAYYGCAGSCYGSCQGSCSGCYGSAYYYTGSCWGGHSCHGCTGSTCAGTHSSAYTPSYTVPAPAPAEGTKTSSLPTPARVIVSLPAEAKLFVDGQLTRTSDKAVRTFMTPELEEGVEYRYVMKAEIVRNGQTQTETQTVIVKAGTEARAEFATLGDLQTASRN